MIVLRGALGGPRCATGQPRQRCKVTGEMRVAHAEAEERILQACRLSGVQGLVLAVALSLRSGLEFADAEP
jgi:hypothetical protein